MKHGLTVLNHATNLLWERHRDKWKDCTQCVIGTVAFRHVFARGTLPCDVLFIGEAPGKSEDVVGEPFVGRSGRLLQEWITEAAAFAGGVTWAITNTVSCRPCDGKGMNNRAPSTQEKANCRPRLDELFEIARPRAVVLVGRHAHAVTLPDGILSCTIAHPAAALYRGGRGSKVDVESRQFLTAFFKEQICRLLKSAV